MTDKRREVEFLARRAAEAETRVLDLLAEIERLKNRQLPEGWHVGKMRGGELVPLVESGHLYLACIGMWLVNSGGFTEVENGLGNDIAEIDGVKTKAGRNDKRFHNGPNRSHKNTGENR